MWPASITQTLARPRRRRTGMLSLTTSLVLDSKPAAARTTGPTRLSHISHKCVSRPRDYASALALLSELESNKQVIDRFGAASLSPASQAAINASAMPEMEVWLTRAGLCPLPPSLRIVHVAGTKGKGTVSALLSAMLRQYGSATLGHTRPVGTYTSPHVVSVRERIALDGTPITKDKFARYLHDVWDTLSAAAEKEGDPRPHGPHTKPFYFRFLTLLALHVFVQEGCVSAVVECGIGGEYDSTNVIPAANVTASVVTQLGIDHVNMLGETRARIAWHKSGIFRRGRPALTGPLGRLEDSSETREVLRARAEEKGVSEWVEIKDADVDGWAGFGPGTESKDSFLKRNVALAAAAARLHLLDMGESFNGDGAFADHFALHSLPAKLVDGPRYVSLRGRREVRTDAKGIEWYLDGAHTVESLAGVGAWFASRVPSSSSSPVPPSAFCPGDEQLVNEKPLVVLLFNQQDRPPAPLLSALLYHDHDPQDARDGQERHPSLRRGPKHRRPPPSLTFHLAVFSRSEADMPRQKDRLVQTAASDAFRRFSQHADLATTDLIAGCVREAVLNIRHWVGREDPTGKRGCKVLVTGSFQVVGAVLKLLGAGDDDEPDG